MPVNTKEEKLVGTCPVCGINAYDRGDLNKPFVYLGKTRLGYPNDVAMPCGINREGSDDKELVAIQKQRCPFETKAEQDLIDYKKAQGIFSGENVWDSIT
jgi:hypothetical protein